MTDDEREKEYVKVYNQLQRALRELEKSEKGHVEIEIRDGVAQVIEKSRGVTLRVVDHDVKDERGEPTGEIWAAGSTIRRGRVCFSYESLTAGGTEVDSTFPARDADRKPLD